MHHVKRRFLAIGICIKILATMTISALAIKYRGGFGESCNRTIRCKSQSWLICDSETSQCGCAKPNEMIYDKERERCVAMVGAQCKYSFASDDDSLGFFYEKVDCVNGAVCNNEDGICACPVGTYEIVDVEENMCVPMKSRGADCTLNVECNQTLTCLKGKCDCVSNNMFFDAGSGTCRIEAGKYCLSSEVSLPNILGDDSNSNFFDCVDGAECLSSGICTCVTGMYMNSGMCTPVKRLDYDCGSSEECDGSQMLSCINGSCVCSYGTSKSSDGFCGLNYNVDCSRGVCSDKFICTQCTTAFLNGKESRGSKCLCPSEEFQVYVDNVCKGVVGGPCHPESGCVEYALCVPEPQFSEYVCECQDGYVEYNAKNCDVAYGFQCEPNGIPCDRIGGLICKKQSADSKFLCTCPNAHDVFESDRRKCSRKAGFRCKGESDCEINAYCSENQKYGPSGRCKNQY